MCRAARAPGEACLAPRSAKQVSFKEVVKVYVYTLYHSARQMQCFTLPCTALQRTCMSPSSLLHGQSKGHRGRCHPA